MLTVKRTEIHEADTLRIIQNEAFQEDLAKFQDFETNPACESLERMQYKILNSEYYTISFDSTIIGGAAVRKRANYEYRISPVFLLPRYQDKGFGKQIINYLISSYPDAQLWSLDTPKQNARNSYFYEKLGFIPVGESYINERLSLTQYQRVMK
ncbi:Acetyltransferase (GNAT) family protein [compost metagenome]